MKNTRNRNHSLRIHTETLRHLSHTELAAVAGGQTVSAGHITNDAADAATQTSSASTPR